MESNAASRGVGQTPFEKSLGRRIAKARMVRDLARVAVARGKGEEIGIITELSTRLDHFDSLNTTYIIALEKYVAVGTARRLLFKGPNSCIKQVAHSLKEAVTRDRKLAPALVSNIKALYTPIFSQNPLAPPFDVARPGFDKELDAFISSYTVIMEAFRAMVKKVAAAGVAMLPVSIAECEAMIARAELLAKEIDSLIQKVYVLHDERLQAFEHIKDLCNAICTRSRFLFGSHDPIYKEINTLKYAIM